MKAERGAGSFEDSHLQCTLFNFSTLVRIRLDRIEVICLDVFRATQKQLEDVTLGVLEVVQGLLPSLPYRTYTLAANLHCEIENASAKDFSKKFAGAIPEGFGPVVGTGTAFYYGAEAEQLTASVTVDLSALHANALLLRTQVVWDAGKSKIQEVPALAAKHIEKLFNALGVALARG